MAFKLFRDKTAEMRKNRYPIYLTV